jgi:hypothetical protein
MKGKKILLLFLALFLPACVFVFLKMFGKNEFEVPVLHQDVVIKKFPECNFDYRIPYFLPDSVMNKIEAQEKGSLYLVNFSTSEAALNRLKAETKEEDLKFVEASRLSGNESTEKRIKECVFLTQTADLVLVDKQKRIRGYYSSENLDDVDRLILEIKIILKKY